MINDTPDQQRVDAVARLMAERDEALDNLYAIDELHKSALLTCEMLSKKNSELKYKLAIAVESLELLAHAKYCSVTDGDRLVDCGNGFYNSPEIVASEALNIINIKDKP